MHFILSRRALRSREVHQHIMYTLVHACSEVIIVYKGGGGDGHRLFLRTYSLWLVFAFLYMGTLHPEATDTQQELTSVFLLLRNNLQLQYMPAYQKVILNSLY